MKHFLQNRVFRYFILFPSSFLSNRSHEREVYILSNLPREDAISVIADSSVNLIRFARCSIISSRYLAAVGYYTQSAIFSCNLQVYVDIHAFLRKRRENAHRRPPYCTRLVKCTLVQVLILACRI